MPVGLNAFGLPRTSQLNPMLPALLLDKGRSPQQFTNGRNCRHWFWPRPISLAFPDGDSVFQERSPGPTCRSLVHLRVRSSLTRSFVCSSHAHSGASSCLQSSDYSSHSFIHLLNVVQTTVESRCFRQHVWPLRALRLGRGAQEP